MSSTLPTLHEGAGLKYLPGEPIAQVAHHVNDQSLRALVGVSRDIRGHSFLSTNSAFGLTHRGVDYDMAPTAFLLDENIMTHRINDVQLRLNANEQDFMDQGIKQLLGAASITCFDVRYYQGFGGSAPEIYVCRLPLSDLRKVTLRHLSSGMSEDSSA
jgi:hypothetical protein